MEENETDKVDDVSYYAILNVPEDASEEAIRRSYRHLAQVFHPDKATGSQDDPEAAANFMRIQEAYEVNCSLSQYQDEVEDFVGINMVLGLPSSSSSWSLFKHQ